MPVTLAPWNLLTDLDLSILPFCFRVRSPYVTDLRAGPYYSLFGHPHNNNTWIYRLQYI